MATRPRTSPTSGLGGAVREHRLSLGLSQEALGAKAGISARTVHLIEHGRIPRPLTLARIASALDLKPSDLTTAGAVAA